jgi:hypothetical protein
VGRVGCSVPEQIDSDDGPARVTEEVDPTGRAPAVLERRAESVDENNGLGAHVDTVRAVRDMSLGDRHPRIAAQRSA